MDDLTAIRDMQGKQGKSIGGIKSHMKYQDGRLDTLESLPEIIKHLSFRQLVSNVMQVCFFTTIIIGFLLHS